MENERTILYAIAKKKYVQVHVHKDYVFKTSASFMVVEEQLGEGFVEVKRGLIVSERAIRYGLAMVKDYMFKFWYEFIPKATSVIEMGQGEVYYTKVVKPVLHSIMGTVFEEMCRYYTLMKGITGEYGCFVTSVGTWWGVEERVDDDNHGGLYNRLTFEMKLSPFTLRECELFVMSFAG